MDFGVEATAGDAMSAAHPPSQLVTVASVSLTHPPPRTTLISRTDRNLFFASLTPYSPLRTTRRSSWQPPAALPLPLSEVFLPW